MTLLSELISEWRKLDPNRGELRKFGLLFLVLLGGLGSWLCWRAHPAGPWLLATAGFFGLAALAWPARLRGPFLAWMCLAVVMSALMSRLILILLYYLVVVVIGLIWKIIGKDPMERRFKAQVDSYWNVCDDHPGDRERYLKMY